MVTARRIIIGALAPALLAMAGCASSGDPAGSATAAAPRTVTVVKTVSQKSTPARRPQRRRAAAAPARIDLAPHASSYFRAQVPAGWSLTEDEVDHSGFIRTEWRDPNDSNSSLLVDVVPGETTSAGAKASEVRSAVAATTTSFGPTQMNGRSGFKWVFQAEGDQRVDYFLNECGSGFAILGSTGAAKFAALRDTFSRVAQSFEPECAAAPPAAPDDDYVPPLQAGDLDCADFSTQEEAQARSDSNGDADGLDADSDGIACESLP